MANRSMAHVSGSSAQVSRAEGRVGYRDAPASINDMLHCTRDSI